MSMIVHTTRNAELPTMIEDEDAFAWDALCADAFDRAHTVAHTIAAMLNPESSSGRPMDERQIAYAYPGRGITVGIAYGACLALVAAGVLEMVPGGLFGWNGSGGAVEIGAELGRTGAQHRRIRAEYAKRA